MPIYLCRWPNGDVSIVNAEDEGEAADRLDEVGDANDESAILIPFPGFMMHLKLPDEIGENDDLDALRPPLTVESFGWQTDAFLEEHIYPSFHEAAAKIDFDGKPPTSVEEAIDALNKAIAVEKSRLWTEAPSPQPRLGPKLV